ncbi:PREDICTED: sacsin-like, partial [Amphimedon queenslandica]|uniref:HEPN domain-containing protein n=1 Tax=Amphimedon queenslandica TaxID=400682 RepID=A0AAN0IIA9_AMPQE
MNSFNLNSVSLSSTEAVALQQFLSNVLLDHKRLFTICKIPLFKALQYNESSRVSINTIRSSYCDNKAIAMSGTYSFRTDLLTNSPLIIDANGNVLSLIRKLSAHVYLMPETEYLQKVAFQQIRNRQFSSSSIVPFMISVLDNFYTPQYRQVAQQLTSAMSNLPFVEVSNSSTLETPQNLFDPDIEILLQLYNGENKFPASSFHSYLSILRQCGLKSFVSANEIFQILSSLRSNAYYSTSCNVGEIKYLRIVSVLKYLSDNSHLFYVSINYRNNLIDVLHSQASQYCWLPVACNPPNNYPSSLTWKGYQYSTCLVSSDVSPLVVLSQDLSTSELPLIAGSQAIFIENTPQQLSQIFICHPRDLVPAVISHFNQVIFNKDKISGDMLQSISFKTYTYLQQNISYCNAQLLVDNWIWLESHSTFIDLSQVAIAANPFFRLSLEPFIFVLPSSLQKFSNLFTRCGVPDSVTASQILSVLTSIQEQSGSSHITNDNAWSIVRAILDWIADDTDRMREGNVLIPVESDSSYPQLLPIEDVSYTDNEMLRDIANASDEVVYHLIHPKVTYLVPVLGITPLSDHLDITEDVFDDAGQHEPLTTRLGNILREYKDGLTIIKEMIQNADDAGATEVNILYDDRTHSTHKLLFKGMTESHGPALIVHNNSTFTKEDFENITKLAGATKANQPLKIGKFGVGFCSVYHITDVPSFVSGEWLYIFDPTLKYLKGVVHNESRPGKKVQYQSKFLAQSQQMAPYEGLFGFTSTANYNGTIFRLPFRTSPSQISSTIYNEHLIQKMKNDLINNGSKLLLFLQHVKRITFSSVQGDVLSINSINEVNGIKHCITNFSTSNSVSEYWLVSCQEEKLQEQGGDYQPGTASVACQLFKEGSSFECKAVEGCVFCFLPLSLPCTGLPVHVNANFAVMSNRSGIWTEASSGEPSDSREYWNEKLMTTVIPKAYYNLLKMLKKMCVTGSLISYEFYKLWPLSKELHMRYPWEDMIPVLLKLICNRSLFYSSSIHQWLTLDESQFLTSLFGSRDYSSFDKAASILQIPVVSLPISHLDEMRSSVSIISESEFTTKFLNNIDLFYDYVETRNRILFIMLSAIGSDPVQYTECAIEFKKVSSIPTSPNGTALKLASELVDTHYFDAMFDPEDSMFPLDKFYQNPLTRIALFQLGLLSVNTVPWEMIINSAKTVASLHDRNKKKALLRIRSIINCICDKNETAPSELRQINFLPVLPKPEKYFLPWKGDGHSLIAPSQIICEQFQSFQKPLYTVSSQKALLNTNSEDGCDFISQKALELLNISSRPSFDEVHAHFMCLVKCFNPDNIDDPEARELFENMCRYVYEYYENLLATSLDESPSTELQTLIISPKAKKFIDTYHNKPFVYTGTGFVTSSDVAVNWKIIEGPYLYKLPSMLSQCRLLLQHLSIKYDFSITKLLATLHQMFKDFGPSHQLPLKYHKIANCIIHELNSVSKEEILSIREAVYLADQNYVVRPANKLVFNDAPWLPEDADNNYVTSLLNRDIALALGVVPTRNKFLDKFTSISQTFSGVPYGQKESLTQRIKNILSNYPFDETFVKELIQNADDAKANEMIIILDRRQHGTEKVLSENWGELQGPALLVWNDKNFSDQDLEGIQKLGLGSKRDDDESIGQFGIGFNVVYHVTDCPSFITRGEKFCVFDPHCKYVPGADAISPGRQYNIDKTFWNDMPDLSSAFLQDNFTSKLLEIDKGVLFRFPLRSTQKLVEQSKIINEINDTVVTADVMESYLRNWVSVIKDLLLFLNHLTTFEYYVINESGSIALQTKYNIHITEEDHLKRIHLKESLSNFKSILQPCLVTYSLTLEASVNSSKESNREVWLIQQGVGDMLDPLKDWKFVPKILPQHGIATTLIRSQNFKGQVFCFLPLPIYTNLPVHINGKFILNSDRRSLWASTSEKLDDRSTWNNSLYKAIASSYVHFLKIAQSSYVAASGYSKLEELFSAVDVYYGLFPLWNPPFKYDKLKEIDSSGIDEKTKTVYDWKGIGSKVLKLLWSRNDLVLAVARKDIKSNEHGRCIWLVDWHSLHDDIESFTQVYFLKKEDRYMKKILTSLCMVITCAPYALYKNLKSLKLDEKTFIEPAIVDYKSVFKFYAKFYPKILPNSCPCYIDETPFQSAKFFCTFVKYMLLEIIDHETTRYRLEFPNSPENIPLLLTADNKLREFNQSKDILCSKFVNLFPNSLSQFVHEELFDMYSKTLYFPPPKDVPFDIIEGILNVNLHTKLQDKAVDNSQSAFIPPENFASLWQCLCSDDVFQCHQSNIVERWALLPSTSGSLYSASSPIRPLIPPAAAADDDDDAKWYQEVYKVLSIFNVPIYESKPEGEFDSQVEYCIQLNQADKVLLMLYHCEDIEKRILANEDSALKVLCKYFREINFRTNAKCLTCIRSLPLFKSIQGDLVNIKGKTVLATGYLKLCQAGYDIWATQNDLVFLVTSGAWAELGIMTELNVKEITLSHLPEVYISHIFPHFKNLRPDDRRDHLHYILRSSFITKSNSERPSFFYHFLSNLQCLETQTGELQKVSYFYDHSAPIFYTFSDLFPFVPEAYRNKEWLEFFKLLKLQSTTPIDKFKECCESVMSKNENERAIASEILVSYLFSESAKEWHIDFKILAEIGDIPFVQVNPVSDFQWIKMPHSKTGLTKFNQATIYDCAELVWTVNTIIRIPSEIAECMETQEFRAFLREASVVPQNNESHFKMSLRNLGVTVEPAVDDVYHNFINISETPLSNFKLFDCYSTSVTNHPIKIEDIIRKSLKYLYEKGANDLLDRLKVVPCIPVQADNTNTGEFMTRPVLVKPMQIVREISDDCNHLFPYVHSLPRFMANIGHDLKLIGISDRITLKSLQHLLETVHQQLNGSKINPNCAIAVKEAVIKIYNLLEASHDTNDDVVCELDPLYLPTADGYLMQSTDLVFIDSFRYQDASLSFERSPYPLFQLSNETGIVNSSNEYKLSLKLPEKLRPFGLSQICREELLINSQTSNEVTHLFQYHENLKGIVPSLQKVLPKMIDAHFKITNSTVLDEAAIHKFVSTLLDQFINGVELIIIDSLKSDLKLLATDISFGIISVKFFIQKSKLGHFLLYLDKKASPLTYSFTKEFAFILCLKIAQLHDVKSTEYLSFSSPVQECLMAQSNNDLMYILEKFEINTPGVNLPAKFNEIGSSIPEKLFSFLQMNIHHIFYPQERVGYEIKDGYLVYAIVLCQIQANCDDPIGFRRQYKIKIDDSETGTRIVSTLDLYKFVNKERFEESKGKEFDMERAMAKAKNILSLDELKTEIQLSLSIIEKIKDKDTYKKAKKRLYLYYLCDKINLVESDFYEKAIQLLEDKLKAQNHSTESDDTNDISMLENDFNQWNIFAQKVSQNLGQEATHSVDAPPSDTVFWEAFELKPQLSEAKRWLKQAKTDLEAMKILNTSTQSQKKVAVYCQVLFLAHETCEKALKAAMYKLVGLNSGSLTVHNLYSYAINIASIKGDKWQELPKLVLSMEKYYLDSRFPNRHLLPHAPVDVYSSADAIGVAKNAEKVYDLVAMLFEPNEIPQPMNLSYAALEQIRMTDIAIQCHLNQPDEEKLRQLQRKIESLEQSFKIKEADEEKLRQELQEKIESLEQQLIKDCKEVAVQFDYLIPQSDSLDSNVIIAGQKLFILQGDKACSIPWEQYGFRLQCPQGAVSKDTVFEVAVTALAGGNFKVPKGTVLVSAVYAISVSKALLKPLVIELEHCLDLRNTSQTGCLKFVRAPLKSPNAYQFSIVEGGSFSVGNRYGSIERDEFCAFGIAHVAEMSNGDTTNGGGNGGGTQTEGTNNDSQEQTNEDTHTSNDSENEAGEKNSQEQADGDTQTSSDSEIEAGEKSKEASPSIINTPPKEPNIDTTELKEPNSDNHDDSTLRSDNNAPSGDMLYTGMMYYEPKEVGYRRIRYWYSVVRDLQVLKRYLEKKHG